MSERAQRITSLKEANRRRGAASRWKASVGDRPQSMGFLAVASAIQSLPEELGALTLGNCLVSVRQVGPARAKTLLGPGLRRLYNRRLRQLHPHERQALVTLLTQAGWDSGPGQAPEEPEAA